MFTADVRVQVPPRPPNKKGHPKGCPFLFDEWDLKARPALAWESNSPVDCWIGRGKVHLFQDAPERVWNEINMYFETNLIIGCCLVFCQSTLAKTNKTPWNPMTLDPKGSFCYSYCRFRLFVTVSAYSGRSRRRCFVFLCAFFQKWIF